VKLLILLHVAASVTYAQGTFGNIVVNGDFENYVDYFGYDNFPPWRNWTQAVVYEASRAASGRNFMTGKGSVPGPLYQDLSTVPGTAYTLRFAFGGNETGQRNDGPMIVRWGNEEVARIPVMLLPSRDPVWRYFEYPVSATTATTRLSFDSASDPWIDDVSVRTVPEPTALSLISLGLACSAWSRTKKRSAGRRSL
jgi:hypothetical protein